VRLYGDGDGLTDEALAAGRGNGASLVELRRIEGSLEDVFVHLTGREMR
jgi:ABC-2 type transport system ATP-binding protein